MKTSAIANILRLIVIARVIIAVVLGLWAQASFAVSSIPASLNPASLVKLKQGDTLYFTENTTVGEYRIDKIIQHSNGDASLMVVYSQGFADYHGGFPDTRINQLLALANQAYIDSGIFVTLNVVHTELNDQISNLGTNGSVLNAVMGAQSPFDTVATLRTTHAADLVLVLRRNNRFDHGNCGTANLNKTSDPSRAYSVVSDGFDIHGTGHYCSDYTLAQPMSWATTTVRATAILKAVMVCLSIPAVMVWSRAM